MRRHIWVAALLIVYVRSVLADATCRWPFGSGAACCQNGMVVGDECVCNDGWGGYQCDLPQCPNGQVYNASAQNAPPGCNCYYQMCDCDEGWTGNNCEICTTDSVCQTNTSSTAVCDNTFVAHGSKNMYCNITSPLWKFELGGEGWIDMQCTGITTNSTAGDRTGSCTASVFEITGSPVKYRALLFVVQMSQCTSYLTSTNQVIVDCLQSSAGCANMAGYDLCGSLLQATLSKFSEETTFTCTGGSGIQDCVMHQTFDGQIIEMTCVASECLAFALPEPPIPPVILPKIDYAGIVVGAIILLYVIDVLVGELVLWYRARQLKLHPRTRAPVHQDIIAQRLRPVPCALSFRDVNYSVDMEDRTIKQVLKAVQGEVAPGEILALMGSSGAGKTTLLDCLAFRKSTGYTSGTFRLNGRDISAEMMREHSGYVQQDDSLLPTATVRETVAFSARLRLPRDMTDAQVDERVDDVLDDLGLTAVAHSRLGDGLSRGISGGELKRVGIACELVTSPSILFLDEPTTGLDSTTAANVVRCLARLAKRGHTVICSIHQPSSELFHLFDKLVLLHGGQVVFSGYLKQAVPAFAIEGFVCPRKFNAADYLLETVNEMGTSSVATMVTNNATYYGERNSRPGESPFVPTALTDETRLRSSWWKQTSLLCERTRINFWRDPLVMRSHFLALAVVGALLGVIYFKLDNTLVGVQDRAGLFFFVCALFAFGALSSLELFIKERPIFVRERANGYYHPSAYFLAKVLYDLFPLRVIPPVAFGSICYWMIGLRSPLPNFIYFIFIIVLFSCTCAAMCLAIGIMLPSFGIANLVASLITLFFMLFGGFLVNKSNMPGYLEWLNIISSSSYAYEVLMVNELNGFTMNFNPAGYPNMTIDAKIVLDQFQLNPANFSMDFAVLGGMFAAYLLLGYAYLSWRVKERL